jgi:hypothetical protein
MTQLVLSSAQIQTIVASTGDLQVCDATGKVLGYLHRNPFTANEIADALAARNSAGPWRTSEQVQDRLRSLEQ